MEITEVRIFLKSGEDQKLKAYATATFDGVFVVRNIKVIQGTQGLFVAMPSRKLKVPCPRCGHRNEPRARFCNQCGANCESHQPPRPPGERETEHRDLAHPITAEFRAYLQDAILKAYDEELARVSQPPPTGEPPPLEVDEVE